MVSRLATLTFSEQLIVTGEDIDSSGKTPLSLHDRSGFQKPSLSAIAAYLTVKSGGTVRTSSLPTGLISFLFFRSPTPIEFICRGLHLSLIIPDLEVKMKSVLALSADHSHRVTPQTLFALAIAGVLMLGATTSLTSPSVDHSCVSTLANRAVVQCSIHGK
jgi:hypothetical protein